MTAEIRSFLPERPDPLLSAALSRLARAEDVRLIVVMPDAHVAEEVCVGTVTATKTRLFPAAVGGDIGCGVATLPLGVHADALDDPDRAAAVLAGFERSIPKLLRSPADAPPLPDELLEQPLSTPALEKLKSRDARCAFGTLGRGNHFLEIERDAEGALWLTVHTGSRVVGPYLRERHESEASRDPTGLSYLESDSPQGRAYLTDVAWAARFAHFNRRLILECALRVLEDEIGARPDFRSLIERDHDHVQREEHEGEPFWVHRKGAMHLPEGASGVLPGSMGTPTYHIEGRGSEHALCSSAHGAGRCLSRSEARRQIPLRTFRREVEGVYYDHRLSPHLREESPSAYKDIAAVLRAQKSLTRVIRRLDPLLVYKAA